MKKVSFYIKFALSFARSPFPSADKRSAWSFLFTPSLHFFSQVCAWLYPLEPLSSFCWQAAVRGPLTFGALLSPGCSECQQGIGAVCKAEQLDGENSYKCSKYDGGASGQGSGEAWGERVWPVCLTSKVPVGFQDHLGRLWLCSRGRAPGVLTLFIDSRGGGSSLPRELGGGRVRPSHTLVPPRVKVAGVAHVCRAASPGLARRVGVGGASLSQSSQGSLQLLMVVSQDWGSTCQNPQVWGIL